MRVGDLLGAAVIDVDGVEAGRVRDVRLVQDGPLQGSFGAGLRVAGFVVGDVDLASRLGYGRTGTDAPWLVARVATWFHRDSRFAAWVQVGRVDGRTIHLTCRGTDLGPVTPVHQMPPEAEPTHGPKSEEA